jgi:GNAT superfamily N-acetyltransferase
MQISMNNHNDSAYEAIFDNLIKEIFGFSFMPWFERKLWDERYESYSIIENDRMLANVCIFKTDMIVYRNLIRAHQFGAVATRKSEQGKGFSRRLMEHVLSKYPDIPAFLSANPGVIDFYPRFGFHRVQTYHPEIITQINNPPDKAVKLSPDDVLVLKALQERGAYSHTLDSLNTQSVQIFHLILDYPNRIYYLPGCGAVVVAEQEGDKLFIADIIVQAPVTFDEVKRELPFSGICRVKYGFCPDWLDIIPEWNPIDMDKSPFFIRGNWNLPGKYRFPIMSET